ncbi:MAG: 50S ribosomal protein L6 [Clostridiales bacterium]|jgi:large subunit ribosomal protein L6|nr:50S ribosomal protein L6 [Clostridiales bacterium]
MSKNEKKAVSRIGKMPIALPAGVEVKFENSVVTVKGPKGTLTREIVGNIGVEVEGTNLVVKALDDEAATKAKHGLYRALLNGMVTGVTAGFEKLLEVKGVGWKVAVQGNKLVMNVGFSHPVEFVEPAGIKFECPTQTEIKVSGISKEQVGQVAANIRAVREPEPYHGYGIRYKGENIERKESDKGKK